MKRVMIVLWVVIIIALVVMHTGVLVPLDVTDATTSAGIMQIFISVGLLATALYVILSKKYDADVQKWAFGVIGTIVGYWLKP